MNWVKFIPPCSACRGIKRIENCRIDKILIFKTKPGPYSNCPREQTKEKSAYSSSRRFFRFIFSRSLAIDGYSLLRRVLRLIISWNSNVELFYWIHNFFHPMLSLQSRPKRVYFLSSTKTNYFKSNKEMSVLNNFW